MYGVIGTRLGRPHNPPYSSCLFRRREQPSWRQTQCAFTIGSTVVNHTSIDLSHTSSRLYSTPSRPSVLGLMSAERAPAINAWSGTFPSMESRPEPPASWTSHSLPGTRSTSNHSLVENSLGCLTTRSSPTLDRVTLISSGACSPSIGHPRSTSYYLRIWKISCSKPSAV